MDDKYMIPMKDSSTIDFEELLEQDPMLLKILAARQDTPAAILARLACHKKYDVKVAVAKNANTPPEVLDVLTEQFLKDSYGNVTDAKCVREATANPSTPASALERVVRGDSYGHVNALRNVNTPLECVLSYLLKHVGEDEKTALSFNRRFNDLIRIAAKLDAERESGKQGEQGFSVQDFDVDSDDVEAWRS